LKDKFLIGYTSSASLSGLTNSQEALYLNLLIYLPIKNSDILQKIEAPVANAASGLTNSFLP